MNKPDSKASTPLRNVVATSEAARMLGSIRTEAKAAASRANGRKASPGPGRTPRPLSEYGCTCGAEDDAYHRATCPRGAAYRRRQKAGRR